MPGRSGSQSSRRPGRAPGPTGPFNHHRQIELNGLSVFYREAGRADAPVLLLLHGFPAASRMFRDLMLALSDRYRVIAPDYPGFGHSAVPNRDAFECTFANTAALISALLNAKGIERFAIYAHDLGAPIGFRLALARPGQIAALIVQNGNVYEEGIGTFFAPLLDFWQEPTPARRAALRERLTLDAIRSQYLAGVEDPSRIDPDNWVIDYAQLCRPGAAELMIELLCDYRTNLLLYPKFQSFLRAEQPPTLVLWGENDVIFPAAGAHAYRRDLPNAQLHLLASGNLALEDRKAEIAQLVRRFLDEELRP